VELGSAGLFINGADSRRRPVNIRTRNTLRWVSTDDQINSPNHQELLWQVVGVISIDQASNTIIFDCQKKLCSNRIGKRSGSDRVLVE